MVAETPTSKKISQEWKMIAAAKSARSEPRLENFDMPRHCVLKRARHRYVSSVSRNH